MYDQKPNAIHVSSLFGLHHGAKKKKKGMSFFICILSFIYLFILKFVLKSKKVW